MLPGCPHSFSLSALCFSFAAASPSYHALLWTAQLHLLYSSPWCQGCCLVPPKLLLTWLNQPWFHSLSVILCWTQSSLSTSFLCFAAPKCMHSHGAEGNNHLPWPTPCAPVFPAQCATKCLLCCLCQNKFVTGLVNKIQNFNRVPELETASIKHFPILPTFSNTASTL